MEGEEEEKAPGSFCFSVQHPEGAGAPLPFYPCELLPCLPFLSLQVSQ